MGEIGQVIDIEDEKLVVRMQRKEACAKCRACTAGMKKEDMIIRAVNLCDAAVGDSVEVMLEEVDFVKAVFIMYGIPFLAFILGVFLGYYGAVRLGMTNGELIGCILGALFVTVTYLLIRSQEEHWRKGNYIPKAVSKADKNNI